jgi:hypothetical protein
MVTWTQVSSTYSLSDAGSSAYYIHGGALTSDYVLFQPFPGGPNPFDEIDARECASYWARYGGESFGTPWQGTCPTTPSNGIITQGDSWGNEYAWATGVSSSYTVGLPGIPSGYSAQVEQGHMAIGVDTRDAHLVDFFHQQAPLGVVEIQVLSVTLTLALNSDPDLGHAGDDWTAIIRKPANAWNEHPQWIDPSELASFPQIGTITPGGSTTLTLPLTAATGARYFQQALYLKSDLSEISTPIDLGLESSRGALWLASGVSLDITWQYRMPEVTPGTPQQLDDLGLEAAAYFEP